MGRGYEHRPRILLGAGGKRSNRLMEWMAQRIIEEDLGTIVRVQLDGINSSQILFKNLLEQRDRCDFAVLFLVSEEDGTSIDVLRERMIFSTGLFIGNAVMQPRRCITVSSVPLCSFFFPICDVAFVPIKEPPGYYIYSNPETEDWCDTKIRSSMKSKLSGASVRRQFSTLTINT
ncbi:MAG: hypothetical protein JW915_19660 [Chitinispirillaceae bacterium]|nr:hypothetical protein [Chitinispirillaceae bacterium]